MSITEIIRIINKNINMNIIAIILSPLIAVIVGELLRKRNFKIQKRMEVLFYLITWRHETDSDQFLKSLNSLRLLFFKDKILKGLLDELSMIFQKRDQQGEDVSNLPEQLITKIIKRICDLEGFKGIAEEDINSLFKKK